MDENGGAMAATAAAAAAGSSRFKHLGKKMVSMPGKKDARKVTYNWLGLLKIYPPTFFKEIYPQPITFVNSTAFIECTFISFSILSDALINDMIIKELPFNTHC